jgi:2-keto-4-pentenoate hydratase
MVATTLAGVRAAADRLMTASATGQPCAPIRNLLQDGDVSVGYAVQNVLTHARVTAGRRIVGRKVGLTSPAVQRQLGVDQPDFGVLFDDMVCPPDRPVSMASLLQPKIEAELAIVLAEDLDGDVSPAAVRAAVKSVLPALEIVDSRIAGWDITLVDTVADHASSALYVLGEHALSLGDRDLTTVEMTMVDGSGAVVSSGTGADCLGDPVLAVAWLARTAKEYGAPLRAGEVILSGALGPMVGVTAGSEFTAHIGVFGAVHVHFDGR